MRWRLKCHNERNPCCQLLTGDAEAVSYTHLLAGINYFVYLFRGNEFIFSDLKSIQTGLSVAGNYEFALDERAGYVRCV